MLWLSDSTANIGKIVGIIGAPKKPWKCGSDHIFDFTWSEYKIIPNMWSELAEVNLGRQSFSWPKALWRDL